MGESQKGGAVENQELEYIQEERKFIHDVSSPLMVALGMLDMSLKILDKQDDPTACIEKLQKSKKALNKISTLLKERRAILIKKSEEFE